MRGNRAIKRKNGKDEEEQWKHNLPQLRTAAAEMSSNDHGGGGA